jgi:peptidylprolyl isomerase
VTVSGPLGAKPAVLIGDETQGSTAFTTSDVITGTGPEAKAGSKVSVEYVARSAITKRQFDSSWDRGKPFEFVPDTQAFAAFKDGVAGMRVGGRRLVIVPGAQAFGASPPPGSGIRPGETLVFVIDLLAVK